MKMVQTQAKMIKNKRKQNFEAKKEYFIKNGGILLEKQIALSQGKDTGAGKLKVLSTEEVKKATNYYDPNAIVCSSIYSTYVATLDDLVVVVKTLLQEKPNPELVNRCLTEASMAMVMNHDNLVKLYGCCLETFVPIQVYEFLPNGSLFQHLHEVRPVEAIKWVDRLRVAADIAYALSYMHNALSKPVVHRDANSASVLLDYSFHAKLSNFGYSVPITPNLTPQRWPVEGTPGYIDSEYIKTQEVTDKCDVYSFGVLMLELLTRRQPLLMSRAGEDLVDSFVSSVGEDSMMEMIDNKVLEQASRDDIQRIARLDLACVEKIRAEKPSMIEIVEQLWQIRESYFEDVENPGLCRRQNL